MYKKYKNINNPTDTKNLAGSNGAEYAAGSAFKNTGPKTSKNHSALAGKLYLLILVGLCIAVILLIAGFALNFFNGTKILSMDNLQDDALNPAGIVDAIENSQLPVSQFIIYAGLITIILVPAAGLIYIIGYFAYRKKYNLALTAAGVLLILALSVIVGLLKS